MKSSRVLLVLIVACLVGCATQSEPQPPSGSDSTVFVCDRGQSITVAFAGKQALLSVDSAAVPMALEESSSDVRYTGGGHVLQGSPPEITWTDPAGTIRKCRDQQWATRQPQISEPKPAADSAHNARDSLDWAGTYRGALPCADCEGIETRVTLEANGSYRSQLKYLGKSLDVITDNGRFTWDAAGSVITLAGREPIKYLVGENRLVRLALDGSRITGALAEHYVMTKIPEGVREKYWKLTELNGQAVPPLKRDAHLILKNEDGRVVGFGGCNSLTGTYELDEATLKLRFRQIASTMMACSEGMEVERAFLEALNKVDNYSLNGDRLVMSRARMAPLLRFEAVYLR